MILITPLQLRLLEFHDQYLLGIEINFEYSYLKLNVSLPWDNRELPMKSYIILFIGVHNFATTNFQFSILSNLECHNLTWIEDSVKITFLDSTNNSGIYLDFSFKECYVSEKDEIIKNT